MAKYSQVYNSFWQDDFILRLTPEEKYFYLYLITNSKTNVCGIYELPYKVIEFETGYNRETVDKLIKKFEEYDRIKYSHKTNEICIKNWSKYNVNRSPKVKAALKASLDEVKDKDLIPYAYPMHTVSIPYTYPMDTISSVTTTETVTETVTETNNSNSAVCAVVGFYEKNIGIMSSAVLTYIKYFVDLGVDADLIIHCLSIAVDCNARNKWGYAKGIILKQLDKGVKTLADFKAEEVKYVGKSISKNDTERVPTKLKGGLRL